MTTPNPSTQMILDAFLNGQGFSATTGAQTSGGAVSTGLSVFNPASSGKLCLFVSARGSDATGGGGHQLRLTTADPALANTITPVNANAGSSLASVCNATYLNAATTASGTLFDNMQQSGNGNYEYLNQQLFVVCPPGTGVLLIVVTSTNAWFASCKWMEF
jgi:hypothetical protein